MIEYLSRCSFFYNHAAIHKDYAVGNIARKLHLVRNHNHRHATLSQVAHNRKDITNQLGVESRSSLVKEHYMRVHSKCTGNGYALLLTTRKLARHKVDTLAQAHFLKLSDSNLFCLFAATLEHLLLRKHDIFLNREMWEEVELLKHHA